MSEVQKEPDHLQQINCSNVHTLEAALRDAGRKTPRFLFRGFHEWSGGGHVGLNNKKGIIPHAFLSLARIPSSDASVRPHHKLTDWDPNALVDHIDHHLEGSTDGYSEFSSWIFDISVARDYAESGDGYVAVIDRDMLDGNAEIYNSVSLSEALRAIDNVSTVPYYYNYEYLAHGPIRGEGFYAILVEPLVRGLPYSEDEGSQLTQNHVLKAKEFATQFSLQYDKDHALFVFIVISLLVQGRHIQNSDIEVVYKGLMAQDGSGVSASIPEAYLRKDWIMTNVIQTASRNEEKVVKMLRAITYLEFGAEKVALMRERAPRLAPAEPCPQSEPPATSESSQVSEEAQWGMPSSVVDPQSPNMVDTVGGFDWTTFDDAGKAHMEKIDWSWNAGDQNESVDFALDPSAWD